VEFVRFHPLLRNWEIYDGEVIPDRATVWIDLAIPDLLASYETRARTAVRKALKNGLTIEWRTGGDGADLFSGLYRDAMHELAADDFYLFSETYFRRLLEWKQARLAVCIREGEPVAAAIFLFGPEIAEYHLSAANVEGKRLGATNLLLHTAAEAAQAEGCSKLYLGGGTDARPNNPLLFFKAGFSAARAEFRIGKHVHSKDAYRFLQERFAEAYSAHPDRVLFYR
jgi:lipid II:glycine glycyltransferase (peptidoglycan interpeptide bridge formation enzyme)